MKFNNYDHDKIQELKHATDIYDHEKHSIIRTTITIYKPSFNNLFFRALVHDIIPQKQ